MAKNISAEILNLPEKAVLTQMLVDMAALRLSLAAAVTDAVAARAAIVGITAKLDADVGVTDTNYAALWNPAVLTAATPAIATVTA